MSWSGGKDSAYALHLVLQAQVYDVQFLLSTFNEPVQRLSMHGVRETLIETQAKDIGIPLLKIYINESNNEHYEQQLAAALVKVKAQGIHHIIFGDIFLEDLRQYREKLFAGMDMQIVFPLWKMDTRQLVTNFIQQGFKTITCCVNSAWLPKEMLGRQLDAGFLRDLPANADPCGENGEYHSFCYDGPIFKHAIPFHTGEMVYKEMQLKKNDGETAETPGFWYVDILPGKKDNQQPQ